MEVEVWRNLPEELLPLILARLPWWSNLRLREVCRSWNAKLSNPKYFSKSHSWPSRPPHGLCGILSPGILLTAGSCALVNLEGKFKAENCTLMSLERTPLEHWNALPRPSSLPNFHADDFFELQAATSGLLLMEGRLIEKGRILMNPLNKTYLCLPAVPALEGLVGRGVIKEDTQDMVVDEHTHNVRIIALQHQTIEGHVVPIARNQTFLSDLELWRIHVYDMGRNSWELVSSLQSEHLQRVKSSILVGDSLYILTKQPSARHRHRHRVFKALATELLEVPADITIDIPTVHLFRHRASLMLVSGTVQKRAGVDIWRLDEGAGKWSKVMSLPDNLVESGWGRRDFQIDAEGDFVCFTSYAKKDVILTINLLDGVWQSVSCKNDHVSRDWASIRTFLWQPRLDVVL